MSRLFDKTYHEETIRIAQLAGDRGVVSNMRFVGCVIKGPAVIYATGCDFNDFKWEGSIDTIFWEILPSRTTISGVVRVENCAFPGCTFSNVGFAGRGDLRDALRTALRR